MVRGDGVDVIRGVEVILGVDVGFAVGCGVEVALEPGPTVTAGRTLDVDAGRGVEVARESKDGTEGLAVTTIRRLGVAVGLV